MYKADVDNVLETNDTVAIKNDQLSWIEAMQLFIVAPVSLTERINELTKEVENLF